MNDFGPTTIKTAVGLSTVLHAAQTNARVRWLNNNSDLIEGVARAITTAEGNMLKADEDMRAGHLWISGTFEHFLPVPDVLRMLDQGAFALDAQLTPA